MNRLSEKKRGGYVMDDIFKVRELPVCKMGADKDENTVFSYFEIGRGGELSNPGLPYNFLLYVFEGELQFSCELVDDCHLAKDEACLLPRSSFVNLKILRGVKLYVLYFDTYIASCDRIFFNTLYKDTGGKETDYAPVAVPWQVRDFFENLRSLQRARIDCLHFHQLKHQELFLLLRMTCSPQDLKMLMKPLLGESFSFRNKVLESFSKMNEGGVPRLAEMVGMSRKTFDIRFKEEFRMPAAKWMKLQTARLLRLYLAEPGVTIADAMVRFNFNSPSHFNHFCRTYLGETPGEMIKNRNARGSF